jgi:mono/diheme cytochrome c family protein
MKVHLFSGTLLFNCVTPTALTHEEDANMRKALKWIGIVLGGLLALILVLAIALLVYGQLSFKRTIANRPLYQISADTSPEGLTRGKYLSESVMSCNTACHTGNETPFIGVAEEIHEGPISGVFAVPNLTSDNETGLGTWTDAEIARAIREGIDKNGKSLVIMPSSNFHNMSDADVAALVGYLRNLEPAKNEVPPLQLNAIAKVLLAVGMFGPSPVGEPITQAQQTPPAGTAEYGAYLVSLGMCRDCHGKDLNGGTSGPAGFAPNLTPGGELASWDETDFLTAIHSGVTPSDKVLSEEMPWKAYGKMTDEDLTAIWLYLKSLPAMEMGK